MAHDQSLNSLLSAMTLPHGHPCTSSAFLPYHLSCLSSLSGIYAIQYSSVNYNMDGVNIEDHNPQENDSTSHSGFTSTPDTSDPADTASSSGKASECWTGQEITLLLDYVEVHCSLNTTRGLNLKKPNLAKPMTQSNQKTLHNATTSGAMYICILLTRFILLIFY